MSTEGSDIERMPPAHKQAATSEAAKLIASHGLKHSSDGQAPLATPNLKPDDTDPPHRGRGLSR